MKKLLFVLAFVLLVAGLSVAQRGGELWRQVEVIRTAHGVPHIRAENLRGAGYALAWLQCEDYGATATPMDLLEASGRWASVAGIERVEADFLTLRHRERTLKNYARLSRDVRDVYEGFAAGVNRYIELHRAHFPIGMPSDFTGQDVAATEIIPMPVRKVRNFLNKINPAVDGPASAAFDSPPRRGDAEGRENFPQGQKQAQSFDWAHTDSTDPDRTPCPLFSPRLCVPAVKPPPRSAAFDSPPRRGYAEGRESFLRSSKNAQSFDLAETDSMLGNQGQCSFLSQRLCVSAVKPAPRSINNDGSNAWAFAPSRTKSGKAILLRNPHLQWTAGYYEAHVTVPGVVDFYGDFRIGGPFAVVGGYNRYLGWSTTNNSQDLDEFYSLDADPAKPDHYILDGKSHPLKRDQFTVTWKTADGASTETREFWSTPLGPVIHRATGKIYIVKFAGDGELRGGEQFLRMMRARSLNEWKAAMKMRARPTSNFTYADRAGNIYFIWNASLPLLPHPVTEDTVAIPVTKTSEMWTKYVPFESLPQLLNPPGGYIHNENSSPHYTNVRGPINTKNAYPNFEEPELSLRSQLAIQLIGGDEKYSLEDVVRLKHNYRMLLADRVKNDLIAAVTATNPTAEIMAAAELLKRWDNTAAADSRGSALFEEWWATYSGLRRPERQVYPNERRFAQLWNLADPFNTPRGLADHPRAVESFITAVGEMKSRYGSIDATWGDVHRVRRGKVDVPVGGCGNDLGCFRILGFRREDDGKQAVSAGDGWVLAVEFGAIPRAYSILAYGESSLPSSPWHADQAEMFARGEMKRVAFTDADVRAGMVVKYRPGAEGEGEKGRK